MSETETKELDALVKQFVAITDRAAQIEFFHENPQLHAIYSEYHADQFQVRAFFEVQPVRDIPGAGGCNC